MGRLLGLLSAGLVIPLVLIAPTANAAPRSANTAPRSASAAQDNWKWQYKSAGHADLFSVLALGRKDVWAFGYTIGKSDGSLALHWTGAGWKSVRLPAGLAPFDAAASSPDNIWLAGTTSTGEEILRYNGHSWSRVPTPAAPQNYPSDLAVINSHDVWAVGSSNDCSGVCTVLLRWNGTRWSTVVVRAGAAQIAASPTGQLWAVGSSRLNSFGQPAGRVLAYTWTGKAFRSVTDIPDHGMLSACCGFTVAANNNVWIENAHWNGKHWSALRIPSDQPAQAPIVSDGSDGVWFGAWAHWTGGNNWINTSVPPYAPTSPANASIGIESVARVPGMTTVVGVGDFITGSTVRAAILTFGKLP